MNPISAFFVRHIVLVFFFYGLAFFAMGLALALASRRTSEFRFVRAIRPLAAFGILHGAHEWFEMFQKIATLTQGYTPTIPQEMLRLSILTASFLMLSSFGRLLLGSNVVTRRRVDPFTLGMAGLWLSSVAVVKILLEPSQEELLAVADVLARYSLGIPGALLAAWALMIQQRTFREHGMPRFGRDLVWCATALVMYGVIGQFFVRETSLVPSNVINSTNFLQWFGVPIQLFRGIMATIFTLFMLRALNAFEVENQTRLEAANQEKLKAQSAALAAERRISREMERLNEELRLTTQELSLLLNLSNLLATPLRLQDQLRNVLKTIVDRLNFADAGMILLVGRANGTVVPRALTGYEKETPQYAWAQELGRCCLEKAKALCRHVDGQIIEFSLQEALENRECQQYASPPTMISLPLTVRTKVIGSIVLGRKQAQLGIKPSPDELRLTVGIAQQLGLSIENARLYQEAQEREQLLGDLLHQVVGAQEAERQRIARELHDATGQSLTAIALGLRGAEGILASNPTIAAEQIAELKSFTTDALGELRQLISDLRPSQLDDLGLVAAIQWYIGEFGKRYPVQTDFVVQGNRTRLAAEYETVLFRITQEALTNVAKHANASRVTVKLGMQPTKIDLSIRDDGRGFDLEQALHGDSGHAGWGLLGIQERTALLGGQCKIDSAPGRGTYVRVLIPLIGETTDAKDTPVAG